MSEEIKTTEAAAPTAKPAAAPVKKFSTTRRGPSKPGFGKPGTGPRKPGTGGKPGERGGRGGSFERARPEFEQKILAIRRVTRVVSGGRRMSFAVAIAIGDKKGSVGVGTGKAGDTSLAINKAVRSARKNMIKIKMTKNGSIPFDVSAKYSSARLMIIPNNGKGMVAGSAVRDILNLAGVKDVTSKIFSGSKNKLNIGRAALKALSTVATKRPVTPVAEDRDAHAK